MINQIFKCQKAIRYHLEAPLLPERIKYLQYLSDNGVPSSTLQNIARLLLIAIDFIGLNQLRTITLEEIDKAVRSSKRKPKYYNRLHFNWKEYKIKNFIYHVSAWLRMFDCLETPEEKSTPFTKYLLQYIEYMREEQCFSNNTIKHRLFLLKNFCSEIQDKCKYPKKLTPIMIDDNLIKKHYVDGWSRKTIQSYTSIIRVFIRFLENRNECTWGLAESIKSARVYKHDTLPDAPLWNDVLKLLKATEGDDLINIRDRAILMLLAIYGLRSSEVSQLKLNDIDWKNEIFYVHRAKGSKPQVFPLCKTAGESIILYLKKVRKENCLCREVFLCINAPYRPLNSSAIYRLVSHRLKSLNILIKHRGPHSLRHACATRLINEGISLKEISTHLGHQQLETTCIYAKVDIVNLRKVADFDIGDVL